LNPEIRELLLSVDDPNEWEFPKVFNYYEAIGKVKQVKPLIENVINQTLQIDESVQDASFFTELFILDESQRKFRDAGLSHMHYVDFAIRFSAFGSLVSIYCSRNNSDYLDKYPIEKVLKILKESGYVFVESSHLQEPYDGLHKSLRNSGSSWWIRYFDYL
jgi:hypothetical protein